MTQESTPLSDLLSDEPMTEPPVETTETVEEPAQPARDEHGRFAAKETGVEQPETVAAQAPPATELPKEEYKAVREEREKRQALERELEALRKQPQEPAAPPPSIWEDEQGAFQHYGQQIAQQASLNAKLDMSEMLARQGHEDFDAMKASFLQMAEQNPAIVQQALGDPHPWDRAYKIAKNAATMQELGATDVASLEAKLREKIMAELQQGQEPIPQTALPPTLTGERNVGTRAGPAWAGPAPLSELLR